VVALRRRQLREEEKVELGPRNAFAEPTVKPYPRWIVTSGVVAYCAVFWGVIVGLAAWIISLF
jgi:hypothetical protein